MATRIASLPERDPEFDEREVGPLTRWLRTPAGTMQLRPIQARACLDLLKTRAATGIGGLFGSAEVGAGKTLIVGLAARLLDAKRPLVVTEASVVGDTIALLDRYRQHWRIPKRLNVVSYHKISNRTPEQKAAELAGKEAPGFLDLYQADAFLLDEVHRLKRVRGAACARRFARHLHKYQRVPVVALSGSPVRDSFLDWVHIMVWALKRGAPVPLEPDVQKDWALLLDDEKPTREGFTRLPEYEILEPHLGPGIHDRESARKALHRKLLWTPGVVISRESFDAVPLTIEPVRVHPTDTLDVHWIRLRELWEAPDGWSLPDKQLGVYGVANQLALGFYYRHVPRPPKDWADARRAWCKFCREVLEEFTDLDTETQVRDACRAGRLPSWAWDDWHAIKDSYTPDREAVWLRTDVLDQVVAWGKSGGIVWINYRALGPALVERTGWPWYSDGGVDARGRQLRDARPDVDPTIIVSTKVCEVGKNLQGDPLRQIPGYARNLFTTPARTAKDWEQRVGRTHRNGQVHSVHADYLVGCLENFVAMLQAKALAEMSKETLMPAQKLLRWNATEPPTSWARGPAYGEMPENVEEILEGLKDE